MTQRGDDDSLRAATLSPNTDGSLIRIKLILRKDPRKVQKLSRPRRTFSIRHYLDPGTPLISV